MPDTSLNLKKECSITCSSSIVTGQKQLLNVHQDSEHRNSNKNTMNRSGGASTKMNSGTITPVATENKPKIYRYTVNTLIEISKLPISKRRPDYLDNPIFATKGFVKSNEIQYDDRTTINRNSNQSDSNAKRRQVVGGMNINNLTNEPRDRIRKEHDNTLMLSPQRRSFNMGCHMPPNNNSGIVGGSGGIGGGSGSGVSTSMNRMDRNDTNIRGRIGSGRIVNRDVSWDYKVEKDNQEEFIFRPGGGLMGLRDRERDNNTKEQRNDYYRDDNKYDRRSYNNNMRDDGKDNMNQNSRMNHRNNRYSNQNSNHNNHYNNHRNNRYMDNREDEPEWFSGGPTSQNDTIELRGFDDVKDETNHSHKFDNNNISNSSDGLEVSEHNKSQSNNNSGTQPSSFTGADSKKNSNVDHQNFNSSNDKQKTNHDFNFEDFLKLDTIPGLLPNNDLSKDNRSSRFSQWFHSDSPNNRIPDSPHSSHQGDLSNMVDDFITDQISHGGQINETFGNKQAGQLMNSNTGLGIPNNESNKYFAPISPENPTNNLLEILQRNDNIHSNPSDCSTIQQNTNKIQSVEELEARMLQTGGGAPIHKQQQQKIGINSQSSNVQQNEMNAFKKLLSQISKNPQNIGLPIQHQQHNSEQHSMIPGSDGLFNNDSLQSNNDNSEGTSLLQLLNKQKDIKRINHTPMFNNFNNMNINQQQIQHNNMLSRSNPSQSQQNMQKFQMSQQLNQMVNQNNINNSDMFSKMLHLEQIHNNQRNDPQITVDGMHWNENQYQAILNNRNRDFMLNNNQLEGSNLPNQLNNSLTSAMIQLNQVGKMAQHQNDIGQQNPLIYSTGSHIQNQKSLRSSPLPNAAAGGMSQRIPSPRELQFHTQSIMQQALIRKKLEEQREKFRRQEIQDQTTNVISPQGISSPNKHNIHIQSPTQIAFTPTSVLRKMTADKDDNNISSLSSIMGTDMNSQNGPLINGGVIGCSNNKIRENSSSLLADKSMNSANNLNFLKHMQQVQNSQNVHSLLQGGLNQNHGMPQQQGNTLYNNPQMQMKWNSQMQQQQSIKPVGRPILKGGTQMQYAASLEYQQQQSLIQQSQQQQQQSSQRSQRKKSSNSNVILGMNAGSGSNGGLVGSTVHQKTIPNQINQQQSANSSAQLHQILHHRQQMQQQQRALIAPQFNYNQPTPGNNSGPECLINYNREGCLSPTSNQLARWFSPELLAQAQAGKLPSLNIGQALSLEEFEKRIQHSSSKVHN